MAINELGNRYADRTMDNFYKQKHQLEEKSNQEIDDLKQKIEERKNLTRKKMEKDLIDVRKTAEEKKESAEQQGNRTIDSVKMQKDIIIQRQEEELARLRENRAKMIENNENQTKELSENFNIGYKARVANNEKRIDDLELRNKDAVNSIKDENSQEYESTINTGRESIKRAQQAYSNALKETAEAKQKRLDTIEQKYQGQIEEVSKRGDLRKNEIKKDTKAKIDDIRQKGKEVSSKEEEKFITTIRDKKNNYDNEIKREDSAHKNSIEQKIEKHGQAIKEIKAGQDQELSIAEQTFAERKSNLMRTQNSKYQEVEESEQKKVEMLQGNYNDQVKEQRERFDNLYLQNEDENQITLTNQQQMLIDEMKSIKKQNSEIIQNYQDKAKDPFYRINSFDSNLFLTNNEYILNVKIPEYDYKNTTVKVQNKDITLNTSRRFEDKISDDNDAHDIATNAFQTLRETFKFEHPVDASNTVKEYKDGVLTVKVPRLK